MKYFYTYKITLLKGRLKGHYYYGQHTTTNLNDGYAGSGSILLKYYKKYKAIEGETYNKEIIQFYNNLDELNKAEAELIGEKYNTDPMCLNLRAGGDNNYCSIETKKKISASHIGISTLTPNGHGTMYGKHHTEESKEKLRKTFNEKGHPRQGKHHNEETKKKISERALGRPSSFKGKHHTEENKKYLSELAKQRPEKKWVHKNEIEKYVYTYDVENFLKEGFSLGRNTKMKDLLHKNNEERKHGRP